MFLDSQLKTSERLIMPQVMRKSVTSLGERQENKVFVPSVVVMDLLRGVEVI